MQLSHFRQLVNDFCGNEVEATAFLRNGQFFLKPHFPALMGDTYGNGIDFWNKVSKNPAANFLRPVRLTLSVSPPTSQLAFDRGKPRKGQKPPLSPRKGTWDGMAILAGKSPRKVDENGQYCLKLRGELKADRVGFGVVKINENSLTSKLAG